MSSVLGTELGYPMIQTLQAQMDKLQDMEQFFKSHQLQKSTEVKQKTS
jgi:hypothetical protein